MSNETDSADHESPFGDRDIRVVEDAEECVAVAEILRSHCEEYNVLGFDCEWVSHGKDRRKVALLQLGSHRGLCALIRLCKFTKLPTELKKILKNDNILKVGVQPYNDAGKLREDYSIDVRGTLDLRHLAKICNPELVKKAEYGLGKLAEEFLGIQLDKNDKAMKKKIHWKIHMGWQANKLAEKNILYAANDAQVAIELFKKFETILKPEFNDPAARLKQFIDEHCVEYKNELCANCGSMNDLQSWKIIPLGYYFCESIDCHLPVAIQMCSQCRNEKDKFDSKLDKKLSEEFEHWRIVDKCSGTPLRARISKAYHETNGFGLRPFKMLWLHPIRQSQYLPKDLKAFIAESQSQGELPKPQKVRRCYSDECTSDVDMLKTHCITKECNVLGFEYERRPNGKRMAALLQLTSPLGLNVFIEFRNFQTIPDLLREILEDKNILKVGIGIAKGSAKAQTDLKVSIASTLDLRHLAKKCDPQKSSRLAELREEFLNAELCIINQRITRGVPIGGTGNENFKSISREDAHTAMEWFKKFQECLKPESSSKQFIDEYCREYLCGTKIKPANERNIDSTQQATSTSKLKASSSNPPQKLRCMVCGASTNVTKKDVVPSNYRMHFDTLKNGQASYSNLLLCISPCRGKSTKCFEEVHNKLMERYGKIKENDNSNDVMLERKIARVYEKSDGYGFAAFEKLWLQHFVNQLKPKFLPDALNPTKGARMQQSGQQKKNQKRNVT